MAPPTKQELTSLVEPTCDVQDRMLGARGMPEHIQRPHVDNMEALKAPVFFLWPGEYLDECLSLLREYKVPISEYDGGTRLRQTLIDFYSDMVELYERGDVISCRRSRYQRLFQVVQD